MNGFDLKALPGSMPGFLKDSDNLLIIGLLFMLMKEKSNKALIIALMSILMQE